VGGIITLQDALRIRNPYITIAGQSAPGGGICLRKHPRNVSTHDVVLRYVRIRPGDEAKGEPDGLWVAGGRNVVVDHCSVSWAIDEVLSTNKNCKNVVQVSLSALEKLDGVSPRRAHEVNAHLEEMRMVDVEREANPYRYRLYLPTEWRKRPPPESKSQGNPGPKLVGGMPWR
jgi:hypothetical protein